MRRIPSRVRWLTCAGLLALAARRVEAATPTQALAIYEPFRVEGAALAPDGRHVAFAIRDGRKVILHLCDTDDAARRTRLTFVDAPGSNLVQLAWSDADRLVAVFDTPRVITSDANGVNVFTVLDPTHFATDEFPLPRSLRVIGIPPGDRGGLMFETITPAYNGDVTLDLVRLDLATGQRRLVHRKPVVAPGGSLLLDQDGKPRVLLAGGDVPPRFFYLAANGGPGDWRPMERAWPGVGGGFVLTARNFTGRRAIPLGFDRDPLTLLFASNAGRDTFGLYALDLRPGGQVRTILEEAGVDLVDPSAALSPSLVFDPARGTLAGVRWPENEGRAHWVDAQLVAAQAELEANFPGRAVNLLGWDEDRARFLVLVGGDDGGRYFVFHRGDGRTVEYFRRAKIEAEEANQSEPLAVNLPDGGQLHGTVILPRHPPVAKPALVVWFHDGPGRQLGATFQRDAQALATMGFVVAQFDYRGSVGYGLKYREAIEGAFDRVPVADALAAIEAVRARHVFDPKRVAVGGEGFGGFLALRALELHPELFRCGIAINAPLELEQLREAARDVERRRREFLADMANASMARNQAIKSPEAKEVVEPMRYDLLLDPVAPRRARGRGDDFGHEVARAYFGSAGQLAKFSVTPDLARLTQPVLLLHDPANSDISILPVRSLAATLTRRKQVAEVAELSPQFALGQPAARAAAMRRIGEFLNASLYDFKVEIGEVKEKEGPP